MKSEIALRHTLEGQAMESEYSPRKEAYRNKLSNEKSWKLRANALAEAAALLEPKLEAIFEAWESDTEGSLENAGDTALIGVYYMLNAFALENLFKAILVKRMVRRHRHSRLTDTELPRTLKTHDLPALSRQVGFVPSPSEKLLLQKLGKCATWYGRYPVPTSHKDLQPTVTYSGDLRGIRQLIERVKQSLWSKPWPFQN